MVDCFYNSESKPNFITVRGGCDDVTPLSGLYANDLPMISLKSLEALSSTEQKDFAGVYKEIYDRSISMLEADCLAAMQKYFKTNILLDNHQSGRFYDAYESEAATAEYKGVTLNVKSGKNSMLWINSVDIYSTGIVTTTVRIYDQETGVLVQSYSADLVDGTNRIEIGKKLSMYGSRKKYFVCYDATSVTGWKTSSGGVYGQDSSEYVSVVNGDVSTASSVVTANISTGTTPGIVVNYSLFCSLENLICENRFVLKTALWYLIGVNFLTERATSERLNYYTLIDGDKAVELKEELRVMYKENLDSILSNLSPQGDTICFQCEKKRMYKFQLP